MARRRRASIRLWQTELFVAVIVVAILILSGSLSAGLESTLTRMSKDSELRNASSLARRLEPEFPTSEDSIVRVREVVAEYRAIYGGGIWVYDRYGTLLESAYDVGPSDKELESARIAGLADNPAYASVDLSPNGWTVAAKALHGEENTIDGAVVTATSVDEPLTILDEVRSRLWVTFWISLGVAGLLGFGFSELIARRMRAMSVAAAAIQAGDFDQRLPTGFVPGELEDLARSYNSMAVRLGEAFSAIEENRRRIAAVIESMVEGVVAIDPLGIVRVANPEAGRLLGLGVAEMTGRLATEVSDDHLLHDAVISALGGESVATAVTMGDCIVRLHCSPLYDAENNLEGAVLLLSDITEQRRIEEAQRRFVADASHEMRTPIAAIKGMLELLQDGAKEVPDVRDDFLNTMQRESERLGRLVSDLLTLAQLEAGGLRLKPAPEFAADLLGGVAGVMHPLAEQAGVTLAVDLADPDIRVVADRDRIIQVLLSFTDNALKHSPRGTRVHLRAERHGDLVRLGVTDEGAGIEPEQFARVFERFYRADAARAGGKGTGLGLAIAKEIVEAHDSAIEVRSTLGEGTTFSFELPAA